MKITVLDGHGLNPGDLSWDKVKALASEFVVYDRSPQNLVAERIGTSEIVLLNKVKITREILNSCPSLRYIGVLATGYNVVDLEACCERGIVVTNIPSYSTDAVAQHVFAFILHFTNQIALHSASVHSGDWVKNPDFCYWRTPLAELNGKTLGIFGFGHIGQRVAEIAKVFGMKVQIVVHSPKYSFSMDEEGREKMRILENFDGKIVSVDELFSSSDFVTLHAPLTEETKNLVNEKTLSLMKPTAVLINTARGGLVDEEAVKAALDSEKIAGYAADVLSSEPMSETCPLLGAKSCVLTPHLAWAPKETRERLLEIEVKNIQAFLSGKPINVVS